MWRILSLLVLTGCTMATSPSCATVDTLRVEEDTVVVVPVHAGCTMTIIVVLP